MGAMADDESSPRRAYEDLPHQPSVEVTEKLRALLASRDEVVAARLRICIESLNDVGASRRPQIVLALRDQPERDDPRFFQVARVLTELLQPVAEALEGTVSLSTPAGRREFDRYGDIVFSRE